jgi:hypothetical protein
MDHCHDWRLRRVQHNRQTIRHQNPKRYPWQRRNQGIPLNTVQAVLYHMRINNAHVVTVHLPYSRERSVRHAQGVQETLTIGEDFGPLTQIDTQIQCPTRGACMPCGEGTPQRWGVCACHWFQVRNTRRRTPEKAPLVDYRNH